MSEKKILIVDDAETNIAGLANALEQEYSVSVAMNGKEALEAVDDIKPDLILLDIMMPGMDGYEVCRRLKGNAATSDIPVIFVTSKGEIEDETKGFALGAADYISKPFSPPIIKARVRTHLQIKAQRDQLKASISTMEHEAEILRQKAELGIQAGCLAHDINNVLAASTFVEFLPDIFPEGTPGKEALKENVGWIMDSLRMGSEICKGYINYLNKIGEEAQAQPLQPLLQPLDMYIRKFRGQLEKDISPNVPMIRCKGYQLKRVFVNLFINAMQALEKRKGQQITLRLWSGGDRVYFSISDNGTGIPPEALPHIFEERFTTKSGGTGLGLFLAKQIVEAHNGIIEVQSTVDQGTTFTLSFPAV